MPALSEIEVLGIEEPRNRATESTVTSLTSMMPLPFASAKLRMGRSQNPNSGYPST